MIPSTFGASPARSSFQAFSPNRSHASVSSTHKAVRFGSLNLHELERKGTYSPPAALMDWLDKQHKPARVRTDQDLSDMTWKEWYRQSPEGQKFWANYRENRSVQLQKLGMGTKRTDLVQCYGRGNLHISDFGLISNILHDLVLENPSATQHELENAVVGIMSYDPPHPFDSIGDRLGKEGDPPAHPPLIEAGKSSAAQDARAAWIRKLNVGNRLADRTFRKPKRSIMGHAARLKPVINDTTVPRKRGTGVRDLPSIRPEALLRGLSREHASGWLHQLGIKSPAKTPFQNHQGISPPVKSAIPILTEGKQIAREEKEPVESSSSTSSNTVSTSMATKRPALQEISNNSNLKRSKPNPRQGAQRPQSTLIGSESDSMARETASKESAKTASAPISPFHTSLKPLASTLTPRSFLNRVISDSRVSKNTIRSSRRGISNPHHPHLNRSLSATLLEEPFRRSPGLPIHKSFSEFETLKSIDK